MKFFFLLPILFISISVSSIAQTTEDQVMEELLLSFEEEGLTLDALVEEYEELLIQSELLEGSNTEDWENLLKRMCSNGVISHVASNNLEIVNVEFQLSLQHLAIAVEKVKRVDEKNYLSSDINKFISRYPQSIYNSEPALTYLYQTLNSATATLQEHAIYKHILVLIVANFAEILNISKDNMLQSETDYARWTRSLGVTYPLFEMRNVCGIRINAKGTIRIRSEIVDSARGLKPLLKDFYSYNGNLSQEETASKIKDTTYEGYDMPFFSHVTDPEINKNIELINKRLDTLKNNDRLFKTLLWQRELWLQKKQFLFVNGGKSLKEIQSTAHIQLQTPMNDSEKLNEVLVPILEAFSEMRDAEAITVFGESFDVISKRNNFLMNDHFKLRYLENQFPLFILVNPNNYFFPDGPPPENAIPPPPERVLKQD